jgi:hypothetical protein
LIRTIRGGLANDPAAREGLSQVLVPVISLSSEGVMERWQVDFAPEAGIFADAEGIGVGI